MMAIHLLAAVVKHDNAGAGKFCKPTKDPPEPYIVHNDSKAKSIVQCLRNPTVLLRDKTEVNSAMVIRHGVIATRIGGPADELKSLARCEVFVVITAPINSIRRFAA
jgi:hypothetical protein